MFNSVDTSRIEKVGVERQVHFNSLSSFIHSFTMDCLACLHRASAEFTFRMGGKVRLEGSEIWLEKESELPAGNVKIEALDLQGVTVTDRGIENFKQLPLHELDISGSLLTGASFKTLAGFHSLRLLKMKNMKEIKEEELRNGLALLAKKLPNLKVTVV